MACIGAVFGVAGYFGSQYFKSEEKKTEYRLKINEKLYNEFSKKIELIKEAESAVISTFNKDFALTQYELKQPISNFDLATKKYIQYLDEVTIHPT
jgi:hypothetical protein